MVRRMIQTFLTAALVALVIACAGPDDRDDTDPTRTLAEQPTEVAVTPSPTDETGADASPTEDATGSPTETAEPTPSPTTPSSPTPTEEPAATETPTALPVNLDESLPGAGDLPGENYFLANEGTQSALDLANSYQDSSAHLERLDEWGFQEHVFREYSRESTGEDDPLPGYVLTTVNEYGSDEQAADALDWLRSLNASQGQEFVDPDPELADGAFASSVGTADGTRTAIVYVQLGPRVYAYFAQGGEPLDFVLELATDSTARIIDTPDEGTPEEATPEETNPDEATPDEESG